MNAEHCKAYTLLQEQQIDDIHAQQERCPRAPSRKRR